MKSSKLNFVGMMQRWMDSVAGQTFLNYAYSWGASIVILGTLFKLTHLPGANMMLFIGMGTEVVVFFLSAFDRPFDKDMDRELTEDVNFDVADTGSGAVGGVVVGGPQIVGGVEISEAGASEGQGATIVAGAGGGGSTVIIGGNGGPAQAGQTVQFEGQPTEVPTADEPSEAMKAAAAQAGMPVNGLIDIIRLSNEELLKQAKAAVTPELEEASRDYCEKLQMLTETLDRVEKQVARLSTDSEEMTNLNRTLTGINTVYELQLKSVSTQIGSIDRINEQTRKMAEQIEELNGVYARMIKALTVNMKNAAVPNA